MDFVSHTPRRMASFAELRAVVDDNPTLREAIDRLKAEVKGARWWVESPDQGVTTSLTKFFTRPDPDYRNLSEFLDDVVEEVVVSDSLTIKVIRTRSGRGMVIPENKAAGTNVWGLDLLIGSTIRPILDINGNTLEPPAPAYYQFSTDVPRVNVMDTVQCVDMSALVQKDGPAAWTYTSYQVLYLPRWRRFWTVYGYPVTERLIKAIPDMHPEDLASFLDTESMLRFLRVEVFNKLIHDVFKQPDASWHWDTHEEN